MGCKKFFFVVVDVFRDVFVYLVMIEIDVMVFMYEEI